MATQNPIPYLNFNGNCRDAMEFYHQCFGGDLQLMPFEGSPVDVPAEAAQKILHACLNSENFNLMASDCPPGVEVSFGSNVALSVNCESKDSAAHLFSKLSQNGSITMPLEDTFWGAYFGMLIDQFGMHWMLNYDYAPDQKEQLATAESKG